MEQYSPEWWKAHLPNIQAFVDGKDVEVLHFHSMKWMSTKNPKFDSSPDLYRIKPATRTINGFEVPAPEIVAPVGGPYYIIDLLSSDLFQRITGWDGITKEMAWLRSGLIFTTQEAAIANAKAMLGIDPKEGV